MARTKHKTISEAAEAEATLRALRRQQAEASATYLPESYYAEHEIDARERARAQAEALELLAAEVAGAEALAAAAWDAALLAPIDDGRLAGTEEELLDEVSVLEGHARDTHALHGGRHIEDVLEAFELARELRRRDFEAMAATEFGDVERLARLWTAGCDDRFADAIRSAIENRGGWAAGSRDDYRARVDRVALEIRRRRHELELREAEAEAEQAEQARREAESRLAALRS